MGGSRKFVPLLKHESPIDHWGIEKPINGLSITWNAFTCDVILIEIVSDSSPKIMSSIPWNNNHKTVYPWQNVWCTLRYKNPKCLAFLKIGQFCPYNYIIVFYKQNTMYGFLDLISFQWLQPWNSSVIIQLYRLSDHGGKFPASTLLLNFFP